MASFGMVRGAPPSSFGQKKSMITQLDCHYGLGARTFELLPGN